LVGTWQAVEVVLTNVETSEHGDLLAEGFELSMTITGDGAITFLAREPTEAEPDTSVGTISLEGSRITVVTDGETMTGTARLDGDRLTFDFDPIEFFNTMVKLRMVFRRT